MKVLSIRTARAIWVVPLVNINPYGRSIFEAASALVKRYGFLKPPETQSLIASPLSIKFEAGTFSGDDGIPKIVNLAVHDDGLVVDTRSSTEDSDQFLDDALNWLASEFKLVGPRDLGVSKRYVSEVSIRFENPIEVFNDRFSSFARSLRSGTGPNQPKPMELINLNFGTDPEAGATPRLLRIEREIGTPFSEDRYFSSAAIQTREHLKLLHEFELAASSSN